MSRQLTLPETAAYLKEHDKYLILSHRRPDGDTVGSCAALCLALRAMGKTAWVYPNPQFTPKFRPFLESASGPLCQAEAKALPGQTVISCDIASAGLLPFGMEQASVELAIDHHGTNSGFAARTHVEADKAACGEILHALLPLLGVEPDKAMAEAIYVAVSTDTGCFRYANVTANTFAVAAACVRAGAEIYPINRVMFDTKRHARMQLEAWLTRTMAFYADGRVALNAIPRALVDELGLIEDDLDDIAGFGRGMEGVEIGVMLRQVEDGAWKVSVRTSPAFDAARICARFGGGGHRGAAGGTLHQDLETAEQTVLSSVGEEVAL